MALDTAACVVTLHAGHTATTGDSTVEFLPGRYRTTWAALTAGHTLRRGLGINYDLLFYYHGHYLCCVGLFSCTIGEYRHIGNQ